MVGAVEPPAPDTQFRRAREALGLADASRRAIGVVADAASTVRRVAFESPEPAAAAAQGSPAMARTPPALKEGYTPLTQEYLRVSFAVWLRASVKRRGQFGGSLKIVSNHCLCCT